MGVILVVYTKEVMNELINTILTEHPDIYEYYHHGDMWNEYQSYWYSDIITPPDRELTEQEYSDHTWEVYELVRREIEDRYKHLL